MCYHGKFDHSKSKVVAK